MAGITRKRNVAIAILGAMGLLGLQGCELLLAGGGAVYSKFHEPDPVSKAYVALRLHDCSTADSEFSAVLATKPNNVQAVSGKAESLLCLGKYDDAIAQYTHAIELDPRWFEYFGRGVANKAKGDQTKALQSFDEGIAAAPTIPALFIYRGAVLSARGDASGARADFDRVSSLISRRPGMFNIYGWALATSPIKAYRDGPAAIQYATRACELTSWKNATDVDTLAAAYAEAGQFDDAARWQALAVQLKGNNAGDGYKTRLAMYKKREPFRADLLAAWFF
jgi:tetratricopeptide (TPR) repeat protein